MLLEKVLVHKTRKSYGKKGYLSKGFFPLQIKQRWSATGNCYVRLIFLISVPKSSGYLSICYSFSRTDLRGSEHPFRKGTMALLFFFQDQLPAIVQGWHKSSVPSSPHLAGAVGNKPFSVNWCWGAACYPGRGNLHLGPGKDIYICVFRANYFLQSQ